MARKTLTQLTPKKKEIFLEALAECGCVSHAANEAKFSRVRFYQERLIDTEFAERWDDALNIGNGAVDDEIYRRAVEGWDEPVFYKGDVCGTVRKYSDTLLIFLAKARRPNTYRDNIKIEHSGGLSMSSEACEDKARKAAQERLKELQAQNDTHAL